ncbi:disintegrin and metalloproteinase domain-containing protein 23 isoform X2 [Neocloeon triangulifer]|uniref:disintegrin and metalloproteinase domain-containing protein 23 isoform X2 n=1 Tax=Neocloeon triangulifer TaxID=2078957 RepID=UPI00286F037C|nr:disintegrin and metalloproteinase domain-containing protein 23 isoform X2 [Neocloeon triangulifer]
MLLLWLLLASAWGSVFKRETDYALDDSYWNEETPSTSGTNTDEVERLLREYRQNQEMVRNIGAHYYQIIYPVQLRHHEKMGISTREIGIGKYPQRGYGDSGSSYRGRSRSTGKHYHRTSILIKAFNHKFRLDLELNTQLLAPNLMQKHFLPSGAEIFAKQEIELCYYHGTVKDYPGASAAFHTCNGVSGVIHIGNETFVIHPFYGGDLSQKHPHVIFEARTKQHKGCANSVNMEWRLKKKFTREAPTPSAQPGRVPRDVRDTTKYIELALILDKAMFEKRNGSSRQDVVTDAIQVANIADLYFRTLRTRVSVVYIETWQNTNQAMVDRNQDISRALLNFNDYTSRKLYSVEKDTTQLLSGETFSGGESGMAVPQTVCTAKSVGISVDINVYEPHLLGSTMAHMIGHNIGMGHDDGRKECECTTWHGCIMAQSIVGHNNVQPYMFSECSRSDYIDTLRNSLALCLLNKPNEVADVLHIRRTCGNLIVEEGEDCDCGTLESCREKDPCCDPLTCKITKESECATGPCCDNCRLRAKGTPCRDASNECDLPEYCTGETGQCPTDLYRKNGSPCASNTGYCFNGVCPTLNLQCEQIWGFGGVESDVKCYEHFNSQGSVNGNCGKYGDFFIKCEKENVRCGSLQCSGGNRYPIIAGMDRQYYRTIVSVEGQEFECKVTSGSINSNEIPDMGLVRDGSPCGDNLICVNQTCVSIFPHIDQGKCPSNHNNLQCSGNGVCTNMNKCYCNSGWAGTDCSVSVDVTQPPYMSGATTSASVPVSGGSGTITKEDFKDKMTREEKFYENYHSTDTVFLVVTLMSVVGGVFIMFALMALCYRSVVVHKNFSLCLRRSTLHSYDPPYAKKPLPKNYAPKHGDAPPPPPPAGSNYTAEEQAALDSANKILTFGNMPSYSRQDPQGRVLFRPVNHATAPGMAAARLQDHKMQLKRLGASSGSEDDMISGEEEAVSFIDLPSSKLPEKGILKKSGPYGTVQDLKDKWAEEMSDSQDMMSSSDNTLMGDMPVSEVERTLKSLNGYHEDILEALRTAASHRTGSTVGLEAAAAAAVAAANRAGPSGLGSQELRLKEACYPHDYASDYPNPSLLKSSQEKLVAVAAAAIASSAGDSGDEDAVPPCNTIRIRNLEDLIRQLEHHSSRHMSPSGSEDIRMSETEADRHYRLENEGVHMTPGRRRGQDPRFVFGRYRLPQGSRRTPQSQSGSRTGSYREEEIYESADPDRGEIEEAPHSGSSGDDEFAAAQQLVRSASEEALPVTGAKRKSRHLLDHDKSECPTCRNSDEEDEDASTAKIFPNSSVDQLDAVSTASATLAASYSRLSASDESRESSRDAVSASDDPAAALLLQPTRYPEYKH